jgi:hypothetical protein
MTDPTKTLACQRNMGGVHCRLIEQTSLRGGWHRGRDA